MICQLDILEIDVPYSQTLNFISLRLFPYGSCWMYGSLNARCGLHCCVLSNINRLSSWMVDILYHVGQVRWEYIVIVMTQYTTTLALSKYCYSESRNLWAVMRAGGLTLWNLIQPTISLEMPVPSQGHYRFHNFPVVDWFCLFI